MLMQQLHLALNHWQQVSGMLFSFVMVVVPFEVKHVSLKFMLRFLNLLLFAHELIIFLKLFKLVAFVIASSGLPMVFPFVKTNPTEFMFTRSTSHMIATLIFLNLPLTRWTRFRVCHNPLKIRTLSSVFLLPLLSTLTVCRLMRLQTTKKAKWSSAFAFNIRRNWVNVFLITKLTTFNWTPFNALVVVGVRFAKPFPVALKHLRLGSQKTFEDTVAYFHVAASLHAPSF